MIPKAIPTSAYGKSITPAAEEINDRPNHVIINMNGTYAFLNVAVLVL